MTPGQTPPLDFDGNGREELAVFRQSSGQMFVHGGATTSWGIPGDAPVPGDYAGDGTVDSAVWRPSSGTRYVPNSAPIVWGEPGDQPVAADYDGNGTTDIAVWRPSTGEWFVCGCAPVVWVSRVICQCPRTTTAMAPPSSRSGGRQAVSGT